MTEPSKTITISLETAEYLSILAGQVPFGNQKQRARACAELGSAMSQFGSKFVKSSAKCFADNTWDIASKKK